MDLSDKVQCNSVFCKSDKAVDAIFIIAGIVLFYVCYRIRKKRSENTCRCPKCGAMCNTSGWSTGTD